MPADFMSDSDSAIDNGEERSQQNAARLKRAGGVFVASALLLAGTAAIYRRSGMPFLNANKAAQKYEEAVVVPPYDQCSKVTDNCMSTKCCKTTGYKCFMKDATEAKCLEECVPGKDGWCTELVTTKAVNSYPGLRLFCFTYYMQDTGSTKKSYELSLVRTQLFLGTSIFGCPKWAVYSDVDTWLSPGPPKLSTIKVTDVDGDFHLFKRKKVGTWVNAMQFYQAWKDMRENKLTADSDWVIKVDVDSVFVPQRLLTKLQGYKVPQGGVYLENCKKVLFGFFGNLEVVSVDAFQTFLGNLETCKSTLDWKGLDPDWKFGPYGEDLFMQKCMDKNGVAKQSDFYVDDDGLCPSKIPKELKNVKGAKFLPNCQNSKAVVMHPFKKPDEYFKCLAETQWTWTWSYKPWEH